MVGEEALNNRNTNNYYKRRRKNNSEKPNSVLEHSKFASASANFKGSSGGNNGARGMSESRLKTMLQDPAKSAVQVAGLSSSMKQVNGMYKRIIKYMSSLLTFDHVLYPILTNPMKIKSSDMKKTQESFVNTAVYLDRLNPKYNLPIFTEKLFTTGVTYQYKLEDSKGVVYQDIAPAFCRVGYVEDGVYRFQFDVTKISDATFEVFPKELQNAYTSYKNGQTEKLIEGRWYQVSDKGVAFTIDTDVLANGGMALPPIANALIDAIKIENAKDKMEDTDKLDNSKIVHSKIETDDKGRPLMELPVVHEYHNALKKSLPEGSVAITNPFDTRGITLNGTGKDGKFSLLDKTSEQLYKGAGVSPQLFADDNSSSQALERSIQVDCQWLYSFLLPMFTNYYNYELKKASKKSVTWKTKFLNISHFDRDEAIKTAKDQLSFGGSRMEYLAYCGMTPIEFAMILVFEQQVLTIDDLMIAKQTSHTMSGNEAQEKEKGRPQSEKPTDTTVRIKDAE